MSTQPAGLIVLESSNNTEDAGGIYQNLASHQRAEKWFGRDLVTALQEWAERFIVEFRLDIAELAVCVDRLPVSRLGHFRIGHNGFGLKGEIAINVRYLTDRESFWRVLGTLLHELLHAWQSQHAVPSQSRVSRQGARAGPGRGWKRGHQFCRR